MGIIFFKTTDAFAPPLAAHFLPPKHLLGDTTILSQTIEAKTNTAYGRCQAPTFPPAWTITGQGMSPVIAITIPTKGAAKPLRTTTHADQRSLNIET